MQLFAVSLWYISIFLQNINLNFHIFIFSIMAPPQK